VQQCRKVGLQVMIKPIISVEGNVSVFLRPSDIDNWFQNYTVLLLQYASLQPDILCIGVELTHLTVFPSTYPYWQKLIQSLRDNFSGKLTYASLIYFEYPRVPFWGLLDYVGLDAYFPLATADEPFLPVEELTNNCNKGIDTIRAWYNSSGLTIPIIFTEVGYPSQTLGAVLPANPNMKCKQDIANCTIQDACYAALFASVSQNSDLVQGIVMFWLDNESSPDAFPNGKRWSCLWTPRGKPAFDTLTKAFL
jgi:hypothetical protein